MKFSTGLDSIPAVEVAECLEWSGDTEGRGGAENVREDSRPSEDGGRVTEKAGGGARGEERLLLGAGYDL